MGATVVCQSTPPQLRETAVGGGGGTRPGGGGGGGGGKPASGVEGGERAEE